MATSPEIANKRRALLQAEIDRVGLANLARMAGRPDRQIKDIATGRASFGDSMARILGPLIRPDLPRDWLIYANYDHATGKNSAKEFFCSEPSSNYDQDHSAISELTSMIKNLDATSVAALTAIVSKMIDDQSTTTIKPIKHRIPKTLTKSKSNKTGNL